ncbi:hypothetical protein [Clostridium sp. Marseille-P299]|uniref:hypothetical protein n=1 Tax=Clostridium sp. Marseille-P299 TaxID=1805477 RepID=UPI00082DE5BC|nr:hypothetical protein [Clostridium sp. Marseille-P299]
MGNEIDRLEIQIQAQAEKANSQLDKMIDRLSRVENSLSGINADGLNKLAGGINRLSSSMSNISSTKTSDFTRLAKNIDKLGNVDTESLYKASNSIRNFTNSINGASNLSQGIDGISRLSSSISKLGNKSVSSAISNLPALATGINNLLTTLSKAPTVSTDITRLTNSLASLVGKGNSLRSVSKGLSSPVKDATNAMKKYADANYRAEKYSSALISKVMKLSAVLYSLKRAFGLVSGSIEKAMNYEETVNLFQTSMKKIGLTSAKSAGYEIGSSMAESYAISFMNKANDFAEDISDNLSLDPNMVKNYQAMFAQMADSMGLVSDTAYNISTSLTMLGNDMASLFNVDTKTMMEKLQSGLSGEIEPLRRLGIDISQSSLAITAQKYGIEGSIEQMSAAAKVQLRWLSIMDQTTVAWGDMAKTIESPANQIRILRQQWDNLTRSIGNLFLPVLQTVLPYINGFLIALRNITDAFATMLGYELPDYSDTEIFTGVTGGIDSVGDSADDANESVKKLTKSVSKFDELNILNKNSGSSSSSGDAGSGIPGLDNEISNKTTNYLEKFNSEMDKVKNKAKELSEEIQPKLEWFIDKLGELTPLFLGIATGVGAYKLMNWFLDFGKSLSALSLGKTGAIALVIGALVLLGTAIYKAWEDANNARLDTMFGNIKLSAEELETVAKRIADNGTLDFVSHAKLEWEELADIEKSLDKKIETINKLNRKDQVGLELTEEEQGLYKQTIDEYISEVNSYVNQLEEATLISISLVVKDETTEQELIKSYSGYFDNIRKDVEEAAKKLQKATNEAWEDGLLELDEVKEIQELQAQLASIQKGLTDAQYRARAEVIKSELSGADLTKEAYASLTKELEELQKQYEKDYKENVAMELFTQASIKLEYELDKSTTQQEIDAAYAEYDKEVKAYSEGMKVDIDSFNMNINGFKVSTSIDALANATKQIDKDLASLLKSTEKGGSNEGEFVRYISEYASQLGKYSKSLGKEAAEGIQEFVDAAQPTKDQLEKIVKENTALGEAVPDSVSKGLASIYLAEAVTGNVESLYKLISTQIENTSQLEELAKIAQEQGVDIGDELLSGIRLGKVDLTTGFGGFVQSILEGAKPGIKTNSKTLGEETIYSFNSGITEKSPLSETGIQTWTNTVIRTARTGLGIKQGATKSDTFSNFAKYVMSGFNDYIADNGKTTETKMGTWAQTYIMKPFTEKMGIHSPSVIFKGYGQNTVEGFNNGISNNQSKSQGVIATWVSNISGWFKDKLGIHSPSRIFGEFGDYTVQGFNNSIEDGISSTTGIMDKWTTAITKSASGIRIDPLTLESNYKVNTSGISGFEDLTSNRTLTINTLKSSASSNGSGLDKEGLVNALVEALNQADIIAHISEREVFNSNRKMAKEYRNMTGRPAF